MKSPNTNSSVQGDPAEKDTGLPWPRSWGGVYLLVVVLFITWVALLTAFMRAFA